MPDIQLLGGVSIEGEAGPLTGPAVQRHRLGLLALLAIAHPGGAARDKIAAYLWPERDAEHARNLLNQAMHVLRRALGEQAILSVGDEVRLDPGSLQVDAIEFEKAVKAGELERAVELYRGPFLDGYSCPAPSSSSAGRTASARASRARTGARWKSSRARPTRMETPGRRSGGGGAWRRRTPTTRGWPSSSCRRSRRPASGRRPSGTLASTPCCSSRSSAPSPIPPWPPWPSGCGSRRRRRRKRRHRRLSLRTLQARCRRRRLRSPGRGRGAKVSQERGERTVRRGGSGLPGSPPVWSSRGVAGWAVASDRSSGASSALPEVRRLAVLPLANLTGDPGQDYFVAGMHDRW